MKDLAGCRLRQATVRGLIGNELARRRELMYSHNICDSEFKTEHNVLCRLLPSRKGRDCAIRQQRGRGRSRISIFRAKYVFDPGFPYSLCSVGPFRDFPLSNRAESPIFLQGLPQLLQHTLRLESHVSCSCAVRTTPSRGQDPIHVVFFGADRILSFCLLSVSTPM